MEDTTDKIIVKRLQEWETVMAKLERYYYREQVRHSYNATRMLIL